MGTLFIHKSDYCKVFILNIKIISSPVKMETHYKTHLHWKKVNNKHIPPRAIGGYNNNHNTYIGRFHIGGALIPGKIDGDSRACYVPHGCKEHRNDHQYEVLVGNQDDVAWAQGHGSTVPYGIIQGGYEANGEPYYIGRAHFRGVLLPGKVHLSHQCCYVSYDGGEHAIREFEVLVMKKLTLN